MSEALPETEARPAEFMQIDGGQQGKLIMDLALLYDVALQVRVELGRTRLPIKDVLALGPGSVVELEKMAGEAADVYVNNRLIARGEVVVVDENFGVRILEIVKP